MILTSQHLLKGCQVQNDLCDGDWAFIVYEFFMNFSVDSLRHSYFENQKKKETEVSDDLLRELGYSEDAILKNYK